METDWKKKYEEVLGKARELYGTVAVGKNFFVEIFPELREGEDERIRKELVKYIKDYPNLPNGHYSRADFFAWLEKQKESLHISETCKENADSFTDEDEKIRKALIALVHEDSYTYKSFTGVTLDSMLAYLEKQKAKERLDRMAPIYNDKESFESALEKAWKYYNESASRTVDSFEDDYIECVFSKGFREGVLYKEKQEEKLQKLGSDYSILSQKEADNTIVELMSSNKFSEKQKEQKPFPKFKVGDTIHCKYDDREFTIKSVDLTNMVYKYTKEGCGNDIDYADENFELVEQKQAKFNDNDDQLIGFIFDLLNDLVWRKDWAMSKEECLEQLKSLCPQPKAECGKTMINGEPISAENQSVDVPLVEWSEEDEKILVAISKALGCDTAEKILANEGVTLVMAAGFLESLRPQPKQEWSKIDEQISNGLIKALENLSSDWLKLHGVIKSDAIAWLKCHHNHPSWKPSEEQEGPEYYQHFDPDC